MLPEGFTQLVPPGPLEEFLDAHVEQGRGLPVVVEKIGEGRSNLTFRVRRGDHTWVLRRPPLGDLPETAHDMLREHRVLEGLQRTAVRAPRPVAACADPAVIGVPFYLMTEVPGAVIREVVPPAYAEPDRAAIALELIDALVELHTADVAAAGLEGLGKPDGYTTRQVARWTRQWAVMATREVRDIEVVREWLQAHIPASPAVAVVHGDYKLDNVVVSEGPPARVRAILDWEMATLGDPLADLGYLLLFWPEPGEPSIGGFQQVSVLPGFPKRAELIARYEAATGWAMTDLTFYRTLALWKLTILTEGLYKRWLAGKSDSDWPAVLEEAVPRMAHLARMWSGA